MRHRDRIHQIKSFNDFNVVSQEILQNIEFSEKKLMLHKLALTYLLHPSRLIESLITDASAKLFDRLVGWVRSSLKDPE